MWGCDGIGPECFQPFSLSRLVFSSLSFPTQKFGFIPPSSSFLPSSPIWLGFCPCVLVSWVLSASPAIFKPSRRCASILSRLVRRVLLTAFSRSSYSTKLVRLFLIFFLFSYLFPLLFSRSSSSTLPYTKGNPKVYDDVCVHVSVSVLWVCMCIRGRISPPNPHTAPLSSTHGASCCICYYLPVYRVCVCFVLVNSFFFFISPEFVQLHSIYCIVSSVVVVVVTVIYILRWRQPQFAKKIRTHINIGAPIPVCSSLRLWPDYGDSRYLYVLMTGVTFSSYWPICWDTHWQFTTSNFCFLFKFFFCGVVVVDGLFFRFLFQKDAK